MANGSTADKARKARNKADDAKYMYGDSESLASKIAKTATGKDLTTSEEMRAGRIIQNRRINDTGRTAARANFMERRTDRNAATERMNAAVGGGAPQKQVPVRTAAGVKSTTSTVNKTYRPNK